MPVDCDNDPIELALPQVVALFRKGVLAAQLRYGVPASASGRKSMICSSLKCFFMFNLLTLVA